MKIKTQLVISYLTLVLVPFFTLGVAILLYNLGAVPLPSLSKLFNANENSKQIEQLITNDNSIFDTISPDAISDKIDNLIGDYTSKAFKQVLILTDDRTVVYDSQNKLMGKKYDSTYNENEIGTGFTTKITIDGQNKGYIVFIPNLTNADAMRMVFVIPLVMFGIFVFSIIVMIVILTKILSKGIIQPLETLTGNVVKIGKGDLTKKIEYKDDNEFGILFREFDNMRIRLKDSLERQNNYEQSRKQLIASITHDLKTPITSINGYIEALQDGIATDEETKEKYYNIIYKKANKLNRLIDDLFAYSKLELGEFQISMEKISSSLLMEEVALNHEADINHDNSDVKLVVKRPFEEVSLTVDARRINQIMDNIIDNSRKYARSRIYLETSISSIETKDPLTGKVRTELWYIIDVKDDGPGIPEEDIPFIFDHFYKVDKSRGESKGGSGLGLAICKQLVKAHGGSIVVESTIGKGTDFSVRIPVGPVT